MIRHISHLSRSGWNAVACNNVSKPQLQHDIRAKYLVVGAGYAGLAAARRLAELYPDESIVVLDGDIPAENSSGRNSGFMIDLPYAKIDSRSSPEQSQWQINLLRSGKKLLEEVIDKNNIRCGWQDIGHYKAATTHFGVGELQAIEAVLERNQVPFRRLSTGEIKTELGSAHYKKAIWLENCSLVQPAELVNGLISSLPENVKLFFNTPVASISHASPYLVMANGHEVHAESIFLCVNTALPSFGYAKYKQLTIYTYAGLSRELNGAEAAVLGQAPDWGVTPVERLEATSRKLGGKRFMLRAGFSYKNERPTDEIKEILTVMLKARYPDLAVDLFEYVWGGSVSLTRNGDPIYKRLAEKIYGVSGCNASGILKMTMLGSLLVDSMSGIRSELLAQTQQFSHPNFIPPGPIRRISVNMSIRKLRKQMNGI